jgi:hypothetical protein
MELFIEDLSCFKNQYSISRFKEKLSVIPYSKLIGVSSSLKFVNPRETRIVPKESIEYIEKI